MRPLPDLRRSGDLVFLGARVVVFLDGCFWHGCPEHYRPAKKHDRFWSDKVEGNRARDADTDRRLQEAGWRVIRVWEHENLDEAASRIATIVREARDVKREGKKPTRGLTR